MSPKLDFSHRRPPARVHVRAGDVVTTVAWTDPTQRWQITYTDGVVARLVGKVGGSVVVIQRYARDLRRTP